jgi:hypothetical protein
MCGRLENTVINRPSPSLMPRGGILVRMISYGMAGLVGYYNDVIGACNVDLHANVCDSAHCCGCVVNGIIIHTGI